MPDRSTRTSSEPEPKGLEPGDGGLAAQRAGDPVQGRGELGGHDPHLGGRAVGDLGQGLEVLVGQQLGVGVSSVDGVEDLEDGARLTLGLEDRGLRLTLGAQDRGLLVALGREDLGLLDTLGREDRGAAIALGAHLLLHGALNGGGRVRWTSARRC